MEFHELADIFPIMTGDEYCALRDDIEANGLIESIWTYEGKILDGRNRYIACIELGIEPLCNNYTGDNPKSFVISMNLQRRHLTKEQQKEIMQMMRADGATYQEIADTTKVSLGTAYNAAKDIELFKSEKLKGKDGKLRPTTYEPREETLVRQQPHVSHNTGNNEWYTPPEIIEKARTVLGNFDLDPASSEAANKIIKAEKYYTIYDDGLAWDWFGRVWMNPPYSQPEIRQFTIKLVDEVRMGFIDEAIVLVNNATETGWFQNMLKKCKAVCFIKGRIKFIDETGNQLGAPLQGQALLYFGHKSNAEIFIDEFSDIGVALWNGE